MRYDKRMKKSIFFVFLLTPVVASAQGVVEWLAAIILFFNSTVIPFIFALAFLFFIWNAFRFFILGGATEEGRENAKRLMLWGLTAFVLMVIIWGIVNMLAGALGLDRSQYVCPDYLPPGVCL